MVESLGWNRLCYDAAAYTQRDVLVKVAFTIYILSEYIFFRNFKIYGCINTTQRSKLFIKFYLVSKGKGFTAADIILLDNSLTFIKFSLLNIWKIKQK